MSLLPTCPTALDSTPNSPPFIKIWVSGQDTKLERAGGRQHAGSRSPHGWCCPYAVTTGWWQRPALGTREWEEPWGGWVGQGHGTRQGSEPGQSVGSPEKRGYKGHQMEPRNPRPSEPARLMGTHRANQIGPGRVETPQLRQGRTVSGYAASLWQSWGRVSYGCLPWDPPSPPSVGATGR